MSVHSVRLPNALWQRLNDALGTANAERRRPIALSTLLRALLERGLDDPAGLPDLGSKVLRPLRLLEQKVVQRAETEASAARILRAAEHTEIHKSFHYQLKQYMRRNSVTPNKVLSEAVLCFEDNAPKMNELRRHTMQFIHSGFFSEDCDQDFILGRLQHWLDGKNVQL